MEAEYGGKGEDGIRIGGKVSANVMFIYLLHTLRGKFFRDDGTFSSVYAKLYFIKGNKKLLPQIIFQLVLLTVRALFIP
jgi:hypothetical protein